MFSRFSQQKIGGRIAAFGGRFLSNQMLEKHLRIGGRFWQFGVRFWASQQFKNQLKNAFFT